MIRDIDKKNSDELAQSILDGPNIVTSNDWDVAFARHREAERDRISRYLQSVGYCIAGAAIAEDEHWNIPQPTEK